MQLEDYGLIGDLQAAALVGHNGAVDWLCLPRFDSASCWPCWGRAAWALAGAGRRGARRGSSLPARTLVLESDFETTEGAVRVIDFARQGRGPPRVMRIVEGLRGRVPMRMELSLRPDYASIVPWVEPCVGRGGGHRGPGCVSAHHGVAAAC